MSPEEYGLWVLAPALSAIGLAVITRRVLPSLALGVLVASYMLLPCLAPDERGGNAAGGTLSTAALRFTWNEALLGRSTPTEPVEYRHIKVLAFTSIIAAMVGIIAASGGTRALVEIIARRASSRRSGQVFAWAAGLIVFFDDYANSMIVGPTMQPIFDRLKLSRAKLAYIVDSTAAPVASIALIGTWLGPRSGSSSPACALWTRPGHARSSWSASAPGRRSSTASPAVSTPCSPSSPCCWWR